MAHELLFVVPSNIYRDGPFDFTGVVFHNHIHPLPVEFSTEGLAFVGVDAVGDYLGKL